MTKFKINLLFLILFLISNIFLLLNYQGLYWDDWVSYNQERQTLISFFDMIQHGLKGEFYFILSKFFNHIYLFRVFVFIAYIAIGYFTYKILLSTKLFNEFESKLIAFISIIVPVNTSVMLISITPFLFPVLIFYFAFYLLTKYYQKPDKYLKIIILFLFFISFSTNSLLVFYGIVIIYLAYMDNGQKINFSFSYIKNFALKRLDFILLPILYFIYKKTFLVTYGLYATYNKITAERILHIIPLLGKVFHTMTINLMQWLYADIRSLIISLFFASLSMYFINIKKSLFDKNILALFILATILFVLACFPYLAVGKMPVIEGWNSRFSLLLGISISMFYIASIALISKLFLRYKNRAFIFIISFVIILMISKNITQQYKILIDWYYQVGIEENFKSSKIIKNNSTFVAKVNLNGVLANGRELSFYEQNGRMKKVFGNDKRLMVENIRDIRSYKSFKPYKQYNFSTWKYQKPIFIQINKNNLYADNISYFLKMLYYQFVNRQKFNKMAKQLVYIKVRKK